MAKESEEMRKGPWTKEEDLRLACFVALFGERRWDFIARVSGRIDRNAHGLINFADCTDLVLEKSCCRSQSNRKELQDEMAQLPPPQPQTRPHDAARGGPHPRAPFSLGQQVSSSSCSSPSSRARGIASTWTDDSVTVFQVVADRTKAPRPHRQRDQELLEDSHEEEGAGTEEKPLCFRSVSFFSDAGLAEWTAAGIHR
ncbi:hypothetical protein ZIOFF_012729 [Zingiber officinale]|uniref:Myb-like domain-containing protein n=1 Tax=Zingiber officinale TaxID=94328 RepID=A0A8J5HTX3_ZINOF|nr:hypothetical protein ZIOFF_012729 [Zingiber officinale]